MGTTRWPYVQKVGNKFRGYVPLPDGGKRFLKLKATAQEASEEAIATRKAMRDGGAMFAMTLGDLSKRFLEDVRRTRTLGTWDFYSTQLAGVFAAISKETLLVSVGASDMRLLIDKHKAGHFSAQTIQHRRSVLRRMFRWGKKGGLCKEDPTEQVEWPTVLASSFDVIGSDDLRAMLDRLQSVPADYDLVLVTVYTGLRRGELARLRVDDVDLQAGVLWVQGKKRREPVALDVDVVPSIEAMVRRATNGFMVPESAAFRGPKKPLRLLTAEEHAEKRRAYTVANTFRRWAKKLKDRRFHPHALRHSLATELIRSGADLETAGRALRHRQAQTTKRYTHLVAADLRKATARLKLVPTKKADENHA